MILCKLNDKVTGDVMNSSIQVTTHHKCITDNNLRPILRLMEAISPNGGSVAADPVTIATKNTTVCE